MANFEPHAQASSSFESEEFLDEPLDTLQIKINNRNGIQQSVSALHRGFMQVRNYVHFQSPPQLKYGTELDLEDGTELDVLSADEEEWLERASYLEDDLLWLLKLPYHRFWSQMVYDESLGTCLDSYLSKAPRDHDLMNLSLKKEVMSALKNIHKLVFLVYLRTSTYKESRRNHMTNNFFGEIVYDNYLFDVPKIMDLCVLYGIRNQQIVSKMVHNIFSNQPKYLDDVKNAAEIILLVLDSAEERLFVNVPSVHGGALKLEGNTLSGLKKMSPAHFRDILNNITDTSVTLHAFLEVHSPACVNYYQVGAAARIVLFYEHVFPALEKYVRKRNKDTISEKEAKAIKSYISLSKSSFVKVFRNLVDTCCIQEILKARYSDKETAATLETIHIDNFFSIFTDIVTEKYFLRDYNILYPFDSDVELFTESDIKLDPERLSYIYSSIHDIPEVEGSGTSSSLGARPKSKISKPPAGNVFAPRGLQDVAALLKSEESCAKNGDANPPSEWSESSGSGGEIELLIQHMQAILPNNSRNFISECLKAHSYDLENAINAVLYDNWQLPDTQNSYLKERKSIFDGDDFDVFSREDINLKNIHQGKSNKTPQTYQNLQKDEDFHILKSITTAYVDEEADYIDEFNVYDDEYDDTYDSMTIGVKEPEDEPEKEEPTEKNKPGQHEQQKEQRDSRNDFCINPEIARQKYDERRQSQAQARNKPSYRSGDAVQTTDQSRQQKDRHKALAGNHNRRKQSDYKKSRGMMPFPTR